jgi:tetratricopeptide (TPR) repeat protein
MQHIKRKWLWLVIPVLLIFSGVRLERAWQWNGRALPFLRGQGDAIPVQASGCEHLVLMAAEADKRDGISAQRHILEHALGCSIIHLSIVSTLFPIDQDMALLATQLYPFSSAAWFWLGETLAPGDHLHARQAYLRNVELSPHEGLTWCRLGVSYERDGEFKKASDAFLNCCHNGDPGSNGCYGAGRMMEKLGHPQQAIEYYRFSDWEGALKRADELEHLLNP